MRYGAGAGRTAPEASRDASCELPRHRPHLARYMHGICMVSAWYLHGVGMHHICRGKGTAASARCEVRGAVQREVRRVTRCDAWEGGSRGGHLAVRLCGVGEGEGWWGALNDASALAVGALEPVLDLIALDEGGYQRAHRAHLPGRVPGRVPRGDAVSGAAKGCSGSAEAVRWRGVAAWRAQRGCSRDGRRRVGSSGVRAGGAGEAPPSRPGSR